MGDYQNNIKLGITLKPTSEVQSELTTAIEQLNKNSSIDLKIDTKQINQSLKEFGDTLNNISNQMKTSFNFQGVFNTQASGVEGVTGKLKEEQKAIEQTVNEMKVLSNTKIAILNDDGSIKETLKDITKLEESIGKIQTLTKDGKTGIVTAKFEDSSASQEKIANQIQDTWDKVYTNRITSEQKAISEIESNENKAYDNEILRLGEQAIAEQKLADQIANGREKSQISTKNADKTSEIKQAEAINKSLGEEYQAYLKLENVKSNMQNKLNTASKNEFVNTSVITELQNKLNSINTNTADKEFKELQTTINNLSSSDSQIVRLQSTISKMESSLTSMKSKYGSLVGDSSSQTQLNTYIAEIEKLKTLMSNLQNGGTISGGKLASELNLGTEASRNLSNSVKNSSSALKLAQQDANSFGGTLSKVLSNAGIYMGAYQGIQMLTSAVKEGAKYVQYLNASYTDMKMTMDISEGDFTKISAQIDEMGKKIGAVSTDMHDIARVYANANTSADEIMQKVKSASELSNVSGMSGVDTTKSIQSVVNQFKLMSQEGATASSATQHVGDVLTAVSRNMQYDFADGIKQVNEAIKTSGSVAQTAGVSLESYASMAGAFIQQTGKTGLNFRLSINLF